MTEVSSCSGVEKCTKGQCNGNGSAYPRGGGSSSSSNDRADTRAVSRVDKNWCGEDCRPRVCLAGPVLLLRMIGMPTSKESSKIPFYFICSFLWILLIIILGYDVTHSDGLNVAVALSNGVWMLHALIIYTVIGTAMCRDAEPITLMQEMATDTDDPLRSMDVCLDVINMKKQAWISSACTVLGACANLIAVGIAFYNGFFYDFFPVVKSPVWLAGMVCVWYFYSFGSALSIPFVYIPSVMLLRRVTKLVDHLEAPDADDLLNDFNRFTVWYVSYGVL
jgi:hypothetical protein